MEKFGIKCEKGRYGFHILRHSAGSITHVRTGDLKLTQKALGHAKVSIPSDIYVRLGEETLKVVTELMTGITFAICDPIVYLMLCFRRLISARRDANQY